MVLAAETLARARRPPRRRPARQHDHRRGVDGRRGHRLRRARRARRRRHRARAHGASRSGSPAAARSTRRSRSRGGPATPSCCSRTGATAGPSTRSRRRRSCSTRSAGCARSGAPAPTSSIPTSRRPTSCRRSCTRASGRSPTRPRARSPRAVLFPPALADADGYGSRVRDEVEDWIERACAADPWLAEHPPSFTWAADIPPMEIPPDDPIVQTVLAASADVGEPARLGGLDSWYDGATYTLSAATPSVGFGPRSIAWAPHDRRVRAGRRPRALRAGDRPRRRALLRDGMSTRILLVARHGQATQGPDHVWTPEDPLTELGHRQAADLAAHVEGLRRPPTRIVASPFLRAQQTAGAVRRGARAPDRDRRAAGRVRLDAALALDARRGRRADALRRHLAPGRRGLGRRDDRRLLRARRRLRRGARPRRRGRAARLPRRHDDRASSAGR